MSKQLDRVERKTKSQSAKSYGGTHRSGHKDTAAIRKARRKNKKVTAKARRRAGQFQSKDE